MRRAALGEENRPYLRARPAKCERSLVDAGRPQIEPNRGVCVWAMPHVLGRDCERGQWCLEQG